MTSRRARNLMPRSFAWSATILLSTTRDDASLPHPKETVLVGFGVRYLVGSRGQRDGPKIFRSRVIEPPGLTSVKQILDLTVHAPQDALVCGGGGGGGGAGGAAGGAARRARAG